jgi:signal peptidase II
VQDTPRRFASFAGTFAVILVLDQATKSWAFTHLPGTTGWRLFEGVFHLEFAFNTGAAFGFMGGHTWSRALFATIGLVAVGLMLRAALTISSRSDLPRVGLGMAAGGAFGNVLDRILRVHDVRHQMTDGVAFHDFIANGQAIVDAWARHDRWVVFPEHGVVDFIVIFIAPGKRWPAFNIADVALSIGGALLMLWLWRSGEPESGTEAGEGA